VTFEETNLVGNVYYVHHLRWQGQCREMFLWEKAPGAVERFKTGLCFVTTSCSCEYHSELAPFDEIVIRMRLDSLSQNRLVMQFDYLRVDPGPEELVARGRQEVACMQREGERMTPAPFPPELRAALKHYLDDRRIATDG
jgi:enediyne biosynthesis thioesterase